KDNNNSKNSKDISNNNNSLNLYELIDWNEISKKMDKANCKRDSVACMRRWELIDPNSPYKKGRWTLEEIERFEKVIDREVPSNNSWIKISSVVKTKSPIQCGNRYQQFVRTTTRGPWKKDELSKFWEGFEKFGQD